MSLYTTLVSADDLARHLHDHNWRVFDCSFDLMQPRAGEIFYREAHIPGAIYAHLERDLSGPLNGRNGRHPLPDPAQLAARLAQWGVGTETQVVAYDDAGGTYAVRMWWLLRWLGHDAVAVLDGGLTAWEQARHELVEDEARAQHASFVSSLRPETCVDAAFIESHLGDPAILLVGARNPQRFRGENEVLDPVAGHIPGAVNRFFLDNLDASRRFKSAHQLRAEFEALLDGRYPEQVVHVCGSGVTACHNLLAMEVAGLRGSRLYPGSWSEWCGDPARPVATEESAPPDRLRFD
ncbi:MAG: sulfurtransferase [Betaproteobacteria bacterium]|nr:sulfurtransferase [Betaproteobacteria bacterium]